MRRKSRKSYRDSGNDVISGLIAPLFVPYVAYLVLLYFTDKNKFWLWLGGGAITLTMLTVIVIFFVKSRREKQEKHQKELSERVRQNGLEDEVKNFLIRFGMGQERTKSAWEYRSYRIDWKRFEDLRDILNEKGLQFTKSDVSQLLRHYIDEREYRVTAESIHTENNKFENLNGTAFEILLVRLYEAMGYTVMHSGKPGDQGGDLVVMKGAERILIQAKCYLKTSVGNDAVQQAFAAQKFYDCNKAAVITTGEFTREAIELARTNNVELISRSRLQQLLLEYLEEGWA